MTYDVMRLKSEDAQADVRRPVPYATKITADIIEAMTMFSTTFLRHSKYSQSFFDFKKRSMNILGFQNPLSRFENRLTRWAVVGRAGKHGTDDALLVDDVRQKRALAVRRGLLAPSL